MVPLIAESLAYHGLLSRALQARGLGCRILLGRLYLDTEALRDPLLGLLDESSAADSANGDGAGTPKRPGARDALAFLGRAPLLVARLARQLLRLEVLERDCCAVLQRLTQELERQPMSSWHRDELLRLLRLGPSDELREELVAMAPAGPLAQLCAPAAYAVLEYMVTRWTDEPPDTAALLISGLHGMVDVECASALWDLADEARRVPKLVRALAEPAPRWARLQRLAKASSFCAGLQAFLNRFGHRGPREVELQQPRWREDPEPLLSVIASYLALAPDASPHVAEWRQHWEREAALARMRRALRLRPLRRLAFERALSVAQRASIADANIRFESARLYASMRAAALELGRRLALAGRIECFDDVFFLLLDELEQEEGGELRQRVAERRAQYALYAESEPPPVVDADGRAVECRLPLAETGSPLRGIAASPGLARGRVWILRHSAPKAGPPPGSVLVAPYADPAWTPLFAVADAVVLETGGLLSPASVLARELGIPSVVAVAGATTKLDEGEEVEVDGSNGTVARIGGATAESGEAA